MPIFYAVAALLALCALGYALRPLWTTQRAATLALIATALLCVGLLYRLVGTPAALNADASRRPESMEEALAMLERDADRFTDHEGWVMLATGYARLGRWDKANAAWDKVLALVPEDANFLAGAAEARAQADPHRHFDARAVEMLRHALRLDAGHQRARLFLGIALRQRGEPKEAIAVWEPLLAQVASVDATALRAEIDAARAEAGLPPLPPPAADPAPAAGAGLTVKVTLDPDFAARVRLRGDATVFVIARAPDGPPMPVAVEKRSVADLPLEVRLDDGDSPMPTRKLSELKEVEVLARLSESGIANRQEGDIESAPVRVTLPASKPVELALGAVPPDTQR